MKTIKLPFILIIFLIMTQAHGVEKGRKTLVLVGDHWCPYNCAAGDPHEGFLVELARRAFYIYGIDVIYKSMPWTESLNQVAAGTVDGIIGINSPTSQLYITTQLPLEYSASAAYSKADTKWIYDGPNSLKGKKLGIVVDYETDESINQYIGSNYARYPNLFNIEDGENAVNKSIKNLVDGRIDVYIEDEKVMEYYTRNMGVTMHIKNAGKISKEKLPIYIGFSAKISNIKKYVDYLEEGVASLKATGEYDELRRKYNMDAGQK